VGKAPFHRRERVEFALLFVALLVAARMVVGWIEHWIAPVDPYRLPEGRATKVFRAGDPGRSGVEPADRLRLFLWYGE
jgi:hypothetical protein